ncbi:ATP synthase F0 subunit C [Lachnoclostridium sp. An181]|uniref:ATP synthase F0 subunit C n=1 Tax=Lachnoclostridium sp. An181 TaxID=1965575 RepID=UPI000B38BCF9|nr:ATP synthase F0 subunit C [Lachnoclostridium sp. An181]OUP48858.1 ATP synthase F0 subunit C [Lachnoclostridium sp. An181]
MKSLKKSTVALLAILLMTVFFAIPVCATSGKAAGDTSSKTENVSVETQEKDDTDATGSKAMAVGLAIGLAAAGGAIGMGIVGGKTADGISRQPDMESKIRTTLMLSLVFIETAIIYALLVVILVIFVL